MKKMISVAALLVAMAILARKRRYHLSIMMGGTLASSFIDGTGLFGVVTERDLRKNVYEKGRINVVQIHRLGIENPFVGKPKEEKNEKA